VSIDESPKNLFQLIGPEFIANAVAEFYRRAFEDVMIGHFFFNSDINHITAQQITFATALLGGPSLYRGKPLKAAHSALHIRPAHFARRQVLMAEVLADLRLDKTLAQGWLSLELQLKPLILTEPQNCR
jgi:hemoglobin